MDQVCKQTQDCIGCCGNHHQKGFQTNDDALFACICQPQLCKSVCPFYCDKVQTAQPDCQACIQSQFGSNGPCTAPVQAACAQDPDCVALGECQSSCQ